MKDERWIDFLIGKSEYFDRDIYVDVRKTDPWMQVLIDEERYEYALECVRSLVEGDAYVCTNPHFTTTPPQ